MTTLLRVEFDTVTKNRVHDLFKGHESALEKLIVVKVDVHTMGRHSGQRDTVGWYRQKNRQRGTW